ncbi:MAG: hypothetical protein AB7V77_00035 [Candidatus Woesearchaeota archaeon]
MDVPLEILNLPKESDACKIVQLEFQGKIYVLCGTITDLFPEYHHHKILEKFLKEKNIEFEKIIKPFSLEEKLIPAPELQGKYKILGAGEWLYIKNRFIEPTNKSLDYDIPVNQEINLMMRRYLENDTQSTQ